MTDDPCIQRLRALKPRFRDMNILRLRVFGSRLRGTANPDSDLDLLVEFYKRPDLLELGALYTTLEEELGCRVDIVQPHRIFAPLQKRILEEAQDV